MLDDSNSDLRSARTTVLSSGMCENHKKTSFAVFDFHAERAVSERQVLHYCA